MTDDTSSPATTSEPPPLPVLTGEPGKVVLPSGTAHKLWVATFLPLLLAGTGQMYNRQWAKGVVVLVARLLLSYLAQNTSWGIIPVLLLVLAEMVDARMTAKKLRAGVAVGPWESF